MSTPAALPAQALPRIGIVTIAFNDLENLKRTLASVREQNYSHFEHWVIDGGSTDGTAEFLAGLRDYPQLRFVSEKDSGLYNAMNKGWLKCGGDFFLFLNAGDVFHNGESLARAAAQLPGHDFIYFDIFLKFSDYALLRRYPDEISWRFWLTNHLCHQACFYSRRVFEVIGGYDESYKVAADHEHFLRIYRDPELRKHHGKFPVTVYDMSGLSSQTAHRERTLAEINRSERRHLPRVRRFFYGRRVLFNQSIENLQNRWVRFFSRTFLTFLGTDPAPEDSCVDHPLPSIPAEVPNFYVLIVNTSESKGGAATASFRLQKGLQSLNVVSNMLVLERNTSMRGVFKARTKKGFGKIYEIFLSRLEVLLKALTKNGRESSLLSPGLVAWTDLARNIEYLRPDVVHLNWVCGGFTRVENLAKIRRPLVWTMHDMWAFCGSEHVTQSERFKKGYWKGARPDYEKGLDLNFLTWLRKKRAYSRVSQLLVTGPSRWMVDCVRQSDLLSSRRAFVVPNGLDTQIFFPRDKIKSREFLNLPIDKKILMFGAVDASKDSNKGFHLLVEALYRIEESKEAKNIQVLVCGYVDESLLPAFSFPLRCMGYLGDPSLLATVYSCADVMIVPSKIESFGQSASEAMACGVPVVAFDTSGLKDIVDHGKTGYLAPCYVPDELARGILWVLENPERWKQLSEASRAKVERLFSSAQMAEGFLQVYREALHVKES